MQSIHPKVRLWTSHWTAPCFILKDCLDTWWLAAGSLLGGHGALEHGLPVDTG